MCLFRKISGQRSQSIMDTLFWILLITVLIAYFWQSGQFKGHARQLVQQHCKTLNLQLLDEGMVIKNIRPIRSPGGSLVLRRSYQFEFSSIGDQRYKGLIVLEGFRLIDISFDAYRVTGET
jgi:hypothetical protein